MTSTRRRRTQAGALIVALLATLVAPTAAAAQGAGSAAEAAPVSGPARGAEVASNAPGRTTTTPVQVTTLGADTRRAVLPMDGQPAGPAGTGAALRAGDTGVWSADGAWCWFGDPRAVRTTTELPDGRVLDRTYFGWITRLGDVQVAQYDHGSRLMSTTTLATRIQIDDHNNPSIVVRPDGRLMIFWSEHVGAEMLYRIGSYPGSVLAFGPTMRLPVQLRGAAGFTYPNPVFVPAENDRLYLFWRAGSVPAVSWSDNLGRSWTPARQIAAAGGERPYVKVALGSGGDLHLAFTDAHPREAAVNDLHYAILRDGFLLRADRSRIGSLAAGPYPMSAFDVIYAQAQDPDDPSDDRKTWIHDIAVGLDGQPVVVLATFPEEVTAQTDHRYAYARRDAVRGWEAIDLTSAGPAFESAGKELYYSGGIVLDHGDPRNVYLSRRATSPGATWEIEKWRVDAGVARKVADVTTGSTAPNVRPVVPRGAKPGALDVLWMSGTYTRYFDYRTAVMGTSDATDPRRRTRLKLSGPALTRSGSPVVLTASLVDDPAGTAVGRQPVSVWKRVTGSEVFVQLARTTTNRRGGLSVTDRPTDDTDYEVRFAGARGLVPTVSARLPILVSERPTTLRISGPTGPVTPGQAVLVGSRLVRTSNGKPVAGQVLRFSERKPGGAWRVLVNRRTDSTGYASFAPVPTFGTTYRITSVAQPGYLSATSPVLAPRVLRRASTVRISLSPTAAVRGATVKVGARLVSTSGGLAIAGQDLVLQARNAYTTTWRTVGTRRTAADGLVGWSVRADVSRAYRVTYAGSSGWAPATVQKVGTIR